MSGSLAKTAGRESSSEELHLGMCKSGACQPAPTGQQGTARQPPAALGQPRGPAEPHSETR